MESSVTNYQTKIKLLLRKFLETRTQTKIDVYLDKLLAHFWKQEETEVESTLITLPILTEWIKEAVVAWSTAGVTPQPDIASFSLNLASLLSKSEERFCYLNNNNFFIKLVNVVKTRPSGAAPSVKLAYIKLLSSFLEHTSGVEWMIACNFWEDIFQLSLSNHNDEIVKESTLFMSRVLEKIVAYDESFCSNVVKRIMLPLGENIYRSIKASNDMMEVTDEAASQYLKPTLKLMGNILEYFLEGIYFGRQNFQVLLVFLKNFHLEERISDFMIIAQSKCLVFDLGKIMFVMQFLELYVKVATKSITDASRKASVRRIQNNYRLNLSKGVFENVMEFCHFGQLYWSLIESKIPLAQIKGIDSHYSFTNELVIYQLLPSCFLVMKYCYDNRGWEKILNEDIRELYIRKLFQMTCHDGIRICYSWRDKIIDRSDLFEICSRCTARLKESRKYFSRDRAVMVVQNLIYHLKDVVTAVKESPRKLDRFLDEMSYFCQVLELLTIFIEEYQITWTDSIEAIDVLASAFDFVMLHRWPAHVVVLLLKLINAATAKYMAPDLALLLDSTKDSTISLLGPLLYAKLRDDAAEVKTAALEIVCTITRLSNHMDSIPNSIYYNS